MILIDRGNPIESENCLFNCGMILEEEFGAQRFATVITSVTALADWAELQ